MLAVDLPLEAVIHSCSRFLSEELERHPDWRQALTDLDTTRSKEQFQLLLKPRRLPLPLFRHREILRIVVRDQAKLAPLSEITQEISNLADAILETALAEAKKDLAIQERLCVLALGKLGGEELNYSSDIDLLFLHDGDSEAAKKLATRLVKILTDRTANGPVYRVDLRLRPEGKLGELVISLVASKHYYAERARAWELQMLIKGRVAAGDSELGAEFLNFVEPLIYTSSDDFSTIESMSLTRDRVGKQISRSKRKPHEVNVKLMRGGIRDIEFLVQCLQRLHGAREPRLRHGGTIRGLETLYQLDLLSISEYERLRGAYEYLRRVEHLLQLQDDRQTHSLPADERELERIGLQMAGESGAPKMLKELRCHMENVESIYDRIVHAQRHSTYPSNTLTPAALPVQLEQDNAEAWTRLVVDGVPYLADQLKQNPMLGDEIRRAYEHPKRRSAFEGMAAPLNDIGALRRFYRREMFRIQAAGICLPEPIFTILDNTSALAEFTIARAYRIALERTLAEAKHFPAPKDEMTVVALGRLGMREFDLASDADLVFVLPDSEAENHKFWTRVAEQIIEILTGYTGDGSILALDTRLRPNGREGLLVQTESAYMDYFTNTAKAWEGIAYMKARPVAGDIERATGFLHALQQVDWRRYGQSGRSKSDLREMRLRLQREQGDATPLKAAVGGYYDADFILMYLRLRGAGMFFKTLNTPERIDILEKMGHLGRYEAEFLLAATTYYRVVDHAVRLVTGRAEGKMPTAVDKLDKVANLVARWTGETNTDPAQQLSAMHQRMRLIFDSVFI